MYLTRCVRIKIHRLVTRFIYASAARYTSLAMLLTVTARRCLPGYRSNRCDTTIKTYQYQYMYSIKIMLSVEPTHSIVTIHNQRLSRCYTRRCNPTHYVGLHSSCKQQAMRYKCFRKIYQYAGNDYVGSTEGTVISLRFQEFAHPV